MKNISFLLLVLSLSSLGCQVSRIHYPVVFPSPPTANSSASQSGGSHLGSILLEGVLVPSSPSSTSARRSNRSAQRRSSAYEAKNMIHGTVIESMTYESYEEPTRIIRRNGNLKATRPLIDVRSEESALSRLGESSSRKLESVLVLLDSGKEQLVVQRGGEAIFQRGDRVRVRLAYPMRVLHAREFNLL